MKSAGKLRTRFNGKYGKIIQIINDYEKLNNSYVPQHHNTVATINNKNYDDGYILMHTPEDIAKNP